jgi:hypothetical protein
MIQGQIARLKKGPGKKPEAGESNEYEPSRDNDQSVAQRLERMEKLIQEMSERLKNMEERLPPKH